MIRRAKRDATKTWLEIRDATIVTVQNAVHEAMTPERGLEVHETWIAVRLQALIRTESWYTTWDATFVATR